MLLRSPGTSWQVAGTLGSTALGQHNDAAQSRLVNVLAVAACRQGAAAQLLQPPLLPWLWLLLPPLLLPLLLPWTQALHHDELALVVRRAAGDLQVIAAQHVLEAPRVPLLQLLHKVSLRRRAQYRVNKRRRSHHVCTANMQYGV